MLKSLRYLNPLKQPSTMFGKFFSQSNKQEVLFNDITPYMTSVTLNAPSSLNALNLNMLQDWNSSETLLVTFEGTGSKAFCAGGDIKSLYQARHSNDNNIHDAFFRQEFQLDYMLAKMKPVQLSIYDGTVMGGGVGISIHSVIRIATENSLFAMPEAQIGFFTDVGMSFFLPRMKKKVGFFLALTGHRLKGEQLCQTGVANYFVKSEQIEKMKNELEMTINSCSDVNGIKDIVNKYSSPVESLYPDENAIQALFEFKTFQDFSQNLKKQIEANNPFAINLQQKLQKMCPLSLRIIYQQLQLGETMSLEECMKMDFRITQRFMQGDDFFEGVRCILVDRKDTPKWKYTDPLQISQDEIDSYFAPLSSDKELALSKR